MVNGNEARPEGPALGPRVPAPRYHILDTILSVTIYNLPCTVYHLLITIYYSPFTIYHSLFTIYYLPFTIYHLLFLIYQPPVNKVRFWHKRFGSKSFFFCIERLIRRAHTVRQAAPENGTELGERERESEHARAHERQQHALRRSQRTGHGSGQTAKRSMSQRSAVSSRVRLHQSVQVAGWRTYKRRVTLSLIHIWRCRRRG